MQIRTDSRSLPKEVDGAHVQCVREPVQSCEADVPLSPLNPTDERSMEVCTLGKLLL